MRAFKALLGLSFKSLLLTTMNVGRGAGGKRKKAMTGVAALLILCGLMLYISCTYSFLMAQGFATIGGLDLVVMGMAMMAVLMPFMMVVFGAQSLVFSAKDADLVLSLPVSSFSIMLARVMALYLQALLMCELLLMPAGVAYIVYGGAGGAGFLILLFFIGILLALIPTVLALLFGGIIAFVVARLPFKNLLTVVFSLLFIAAIMVGSFSISFGMNDPAAIDVDGIRQALTGAVPPLQWIYNGAHGSILSILLLALITVVPFLLVVWVFSRFYKGMLTSLSSHRLRTDFKLRRMGARGSFSALFGKEARKFFTTPAYLLNAGVGTLLTIILSVAAVIYRGRVQEFLNMIRLGGEGAILDTYLAPLLLITVAFLCACDFVSCVSVSLEGKTLWILKESPVSVGKIFTAKVGINFLLSGCTVLVCTPLLGWALGLPPVDVALVLIIGLMFSLLTSISGLMVNLWLPRMDAENETIVIKQSASVLLCMLLNMVLIGVFVVVYLLTKGLGFVAFSGITILLLAALNALFIVLLNTSGRKIFARL